MLKEVNFQERTPLAPFTVITSWVRLSYSFNLSLSFD